jgi:hypothetical protein
VSTWLAHRVWKGHSKGEQTPRELRYTRAAWGFVVFACLSPWGINVLSGLTFCNFRLIGLAFGLLLAAVPPRWFASAEPRQGLAVFCLVSFVNFAAHGLLFGREARPPLRLMAKAAASGGGPLLQLVFHDTSAYFAKAFHLTHTLPMYYTIIYGGVCTQFWAKYSLHLPIDYKPKMRPAQAPDWSPAKFNADKHLKDVSWVLIQAAGDGETDENVAEAAKARAALDERTDLAECDGTWCLLKVRK